MEEVTKKKGFLGLNSLSSEDKTKYVVILIGVLIVIILLSYGVYNYMGDDNNGEVEELTSPETEQIEYNSKLEALNPKTKNEGNRDLETTFNKINYENESEENNYDLNLNKLDKQLSQLGNPKAEKNNFSAQNSYFEDSRKNTGRNSNNHNVYGDYSMWQDEEPENSRIEYSAKKNNKSKEIKPIDNDKIENVVSSVPVTPTTIAPVENALQKEVEPIEIDANVVQNGKIRTGSVLSFVINDPITYKGKKIPKGSIFYGRVTLIRDRAMVKLYKINSKFGSFMLKHATLLGQDGEEGLYISNYVEDEDGVVEREARYEVSNQLSNIPVVGSMLSGIARTKKKKVREEEIRLNPKVTILLYEN